MGKIIASLPRKQSNNNDNDDDDDAKDTLSQTNVPSPKNEKENSILSIEERMDAMEHLFREQLVKMEKRLHSQSKSIEHLKYRNCKLQMQMHAKQGCANDFLIIFESSS